MTNSRQQLAAVEALERRLLEPDVRSSRERLEELLAEDFIEFGSSGRVWTREEIVADLLTVASSNIEIDRVESRFISEGVILITYRSRRSGVADNAEALRSSIWRLTGNTWELVFHQGTRTGD